MPGPEASQSGPGFLLRLEESRAAPAERGPPSYEALLAGEKLLASTFLAMGTGPGFVIAGKAGSVRAGFCRFPRSKWYEKH